jgi:fucose permease
MLRIRNEPVPGLLVGQLYHYVDDFDLDGTVDLGSTTLLQGEPHAPVGVVSQFFYRGTGIAATNFVVTIRSSMTTASKSRSSTWANSIF